MPIDQSVQLTGIRFENPFLLSSDPPRAVVGREGRGQWLPRTTAGLGPR